MNRSAQQQISDIELPAPGTWTLDTTHSSVGFVVRHMKVAKVRGQFRDFRGTVHVAERPEDSWADVEIDAASIDSAQAMRDDHLRSPDFLDAARFPHLRFRSTGLEVTGEDSFALHGELTIRDITRPVTLAVLYNGAAESRTGFSAAAEIDRDEWGLTWNQALESGGWLVGKKIRIEIEVEAVRGDD